MKRPLALTLLLSACLATTIHAADPSGFWKGAIELPTGNLDINVTLENRDAEWSGTIDIPAQGLRGHALSGIEVAAERVVFAIEGIPGKPVFDGKLNEPEKTLSGKFSQGGQELPFSLRRAEKEPAPASTKPDKPVPGEGLAGEWASTLDVGVAKLRLALHVSKTADGALEASMDSLDQGANGIEIDEIAMLDHKVTFKIAKIGGSFTGKMNDDGSAIEGTWSQIGNDYPLTYHRREKALVLNRPQEPKPPFPYNVKDVTFRNESAKIKLAGTLITPKGKGPFPAVLFVSGSGAQDRDEALMGHRPFLVIADYLASRGIASLRYDDRGFAKSEGDHMKSTTADFATDAEAGLAFLAKQAKIDPKAIGIIGHSEGGLVGPMVAVKNDAIDFLVLLAPPGEPLDQLVKRQTRDQLTHSGVEQALIEKVLKDHDEDMALIKDKTMARDELKTKLRARGKEMTESLTEEELKALQYDEAKGEQQLELVTTPWFRALVREDPAVYLKQVKIPVLALLTEKDVQVAATVNAPIIEASLNAGGNEDYLVRILPGLNHLFQHAETGAMQEYADIEETFAPEALEPIGNWIEKRFAPEKSN